MVFGGLFLLLGFITAVLSVLGRDTAQLRAQALPADPSAWAKLVKAVTDLVKVAPMWFLLAGTGLALVIIGNGTT